MKLDKSANYTILGAGVSGISCSYHLAQKEIKSTIFEKNNTWGGLCDNFIINDFLFDYCIHLSFTNIDYVKENIIKSVEYYSHTPDISNFFNSIWIKHPAQNNLYPIDIDNKIKIITDFVEKKVIDNPENYKEWLISTYGTSFSELFPFKYTRKYWTVEPEILTTDWIENRFYVPSLEEMLRGAFSDQKKNFYYAKKMYYPKQGGFKSFFKKMATGCDIIYNKKVNEIDFKKKVIYFEDATKHHYEYLVSSIPANEFIFMVKKAPLSIINAAKKLNVTSAFIVSIGFKVPDVPKHLWFYIYDEDNYPSRCYSPSLKSINNVPENCSSLQYEVYSSKYKSIEMADDNLLNHIIEKFNNIGLFSKNDIIMTDIRKVTHANVIFDFDYELNRNIVLDYLKNNNIISIGRFGKWEYLWSDQSVMSGVI